LYLGADLSIYKVSLSAFYITCKKLFDFALNP
jgi:hypothetical protein